MAGIGCSSAKASIRVNNRGVGGHREPCFLPRTSRLSAFKGVEASEQPTPWEHTCFQNADYAETLIKDLCDVCRSLHYSDIQQDESGQTTHTRPTTNWVHIKVFETAERSQRSYAKMGAPVALAAPQTSLTSFFLRILSCAQLPQMRGIRSQERAPLTWILGMSRYQHTVYLHISCQYNRSTQRCCKAARKVVTASQKTYVHLGVLHSLF